MYHDNWPLKTTTEMDLKIQRSTANGYNGGQKINDNKIYIKSNEQISTWI